MKLLRNLFGWFTLISLMLWVGVAGYLLLVQYRDPPPSGWPSTYTSCVENWAQREPAEKSAAVTARCAEYYALLGDRSAPWLRRLQQQVQGRLSERIVSAYLAKAGPPLHGQVVGGREIVAALGMPEIIRHFYALIGDAATPPTAARRAQLRCQLELTRRYPAGTDSMQIAQDCMRF